MNRTALAGLCGLLIVGGIMLAISGLKPVPIATKPQTRRLPADPLRKRRMIAAAVGGFVVLVITRWPVAAIAGGAVGWGAAGMKGTKERKSVEQRTEAIALWAEMLRDAIGTARGVEGVLVATAATSPISIRPELQRMAKRLADEPLDVVLDGLAADLDHPVGDLVVTALRMSSTAGGGQIRDVLNSLAATAYAEAEAQRRIDVARERPRTAMKYTAVVITGFVVLLTVFSHRYLKPYDSAIGQVVLAFVGGYWALGFWWMQRMGRPDPTPRYLNSTVEELKV